MRLINKETPAGFALHLAYEMHKRNIISVADLYAFERALKDLASKEAEKLETSFGSVESDK